MNRHLSDEQLTEWLADKGDAWSCEHLQQCAECAAEANQLRVSLASFADAMRREAAASERRVMLGQVVPQSSSHLWRWTLAGAAAILVFAASFLLSPSKPPHPGNPAGETLAALQQPAGTAIHPPARTASVRQDPDDVFLMNLQSDLQQEVPSALEPALVIVSERNQYAQQAMANSQGETR